MDVSRLISHADDGCASDLATDLSQRVTVRAELRVAVRGLVESFGNRD